LTDYGLAPIYSDSRFTAAPGRVGVSRWLAPEAILGTMRGAESKQADVFSFAMLAIEVYTGKVPFGEVSNEAAVLHIAQGTDRSFLIRRKDLQVGGGNS